MWSWWGGDCGDGWRWEGLVLVRVGNLYSGSLGIWGLCEGVRVLVSVSVCECTFNTTGTKFPT